MSEFIEDLLMSCKSIEELERMKKVVLNLRKEENLIKNCKHHIVYFYDTVIEYDSYNENICLCCGSYTEGGKKVIYPKYLNDCKQRYIASKVFMNIYHNLINTKKEDEVIEELINFQNFLNDEKILKDIEDDSIESAIIDSYEIFKKLNKLVKRK